MIVEQTFHAKNISKLYDEDKQIDPILRKLRIEEEQSRLRELTLVLSYEKMDCITLNDISNIITYMKDKLKEQYSRKIKFYLKGPIIVRLSSEEINPVNQDDLTSKFNALLNKVQKTDIVDSEA